MNQHEEKVQLLRKYAFSISNNFPFDFGNDVTDKKLINATKRFASGVQRKTVLGFYDTTITGSGKNGYIFTDDKVYYLETLEKPKKLWYDDIDHIELLGEKEKDCDRILRITLQDGTSVTWTSCFLNKTPLKNFFEDLLKFENESAAAAPILEYQKTDLYGAEAGGLSAGAYHSVNHLYDQEKFHARQGHGFAAEQANALYDKISGHDAKVIGDDFAKDGADRIVDGVLIQSKYCATGSRCINECFGENGNGAFRYMADGKPMQIEVPSDKYDAAVQAMEEKIRNGQVENVSDPAEAKSIVRKGHFTYEQAKNIAKAGTVESLTYDAVKGIIVASSAFGVTALLSFAAAVWNGEDFDNALKIATYSGLKVGGTAFAASIIASQLSRAGLNSAMVGSSEAFVAVMGPKASAVLINAFRSGSNIYGAAAMKSAAKLLRGNTITAGVTVIILSSFDISNIFQGRISGKQLCKNLANTTTTVAGGAGGWLGGAAIGSAIFPGVGTIIGGLIGSVGVGALSGKATDKILGNFLEDDAEEMVRIIEKEFGSMTGEYLVSQKEAEKAADKLSAQLSGKVLKDMYASKDRHAYARNLLTPIFDSLAAARKKISVPSRSQMVFGLKTILEDLSLPAEPAGR